MRSKPIAMVALLVGIIVANCFFGGKAEAIVPVSFLANEIKIDQELDAHTKNTPHLPFIPKDRNYDVEYRNGFVLTTQSGIESHPSNNNSHPTQIVGPVIFHNVIAVLDGRGNIILRPGNGNPDRQTVTVIDNLPITVKRGEASIPAFQRLRSLYLYYSATNSGTPWTVML